MAGWHGADPYDGLWTDRWPPALLRRPRGRQVIVQAHARAPLDIRRLYRRRHPRLAKTLAVFGSAAVCLHRIEPGPQHADLIRGPLDQLNAERAGHPDAWGYPFPVQTRWSYYPAHTPNVVVTAFAIEALRAAGSELGRSDYRERAAGAARWALADLFARPEGWFTYHPRSRALIHNANLLGARSVWTTIATADDAAADAVRSAVEHTLAAQLDDGSFPYGDASGLGWSDSFHTGYVLGCLADMRDVSPGVDAALERGARYYVDNFFGRDGEARLWPHRRYPEDGHSAGTALSTLAVLARAGFADEARLAAVQRRVLSHIVRDDGHAVHRRGRLFTSRVDYPRWCDSHVALGLAYSAWIRQG